MASTLYNISSGAILFTDSVAPPALGLQNAFPLDEVYSVVEGIDVFSGACSVAGLQDCTAACLNPSVMFGSLEIFHNCLVYPAVADLYVNGSLSDSPLTDSLGIENHSQTTQTATYITSTIYNCLLDYCREDQQCQSDLQQNHTFSYSVFNGSIQGRARPLYTASSSIFGFDVCHYVAPFSFLNADIGGIGVRITLCDFGARSLNYHLLTRFTSPTGFRLVLLFSGHT